MTPPNYYSNSQNSMISFDNSWFLAKNLSYFVSLPWKLTGIAIPKIVQRYTVLFPGCLCHKCCPLNKNDSDIAIRYTTVMTRFRWSPASCEEIWNQQRGQLKKIISKLLFELQCLCFRLSVWVSFCKNTLLNGCTYQKILV